MEIFIEPERGGKEFCQFVCNAKGAVWDAKHTLQPDAGSASNSSWNGDWRAKTQVGKDGWTMEAVFPYSIFGISPVPGKKWGLGVNRNFKGGKSYGQIQTEYVMWSPSEKGFCDAKSFGVLWFDGEKEVLESLRVRMEKIRTVALSVRQKIEKCLEDKNVPRRTEFEQRTATLFNPLTSIEKNRTSPYVAAVEMETQCYKIQKEWQGLYWDIRFSMLLGE
ncbi:MAG: hypothetical protein WCP55_11545 [Lentisphaerota bacterium]